jgi:hypothetical protein
VDDQTTMRQDWRAQATGNNAADLSRTRIKMLRTPLVSLLVAAALTGGLAACGEDEQPATDSATQEQRTDGATEGGDGAQPSQDGQAAVEACTQSVRDRPELSAELKSELEDICEEAGNGDPEAVKATTRKVCERIVEESVPEAAREQALETCRTATQ